MELIDFHQLIMNGMMHLNELTHLDQIWFSDCYEKVYAFINHPLPVGLDFKIPEEFNEIHRLCYSLEQPSFCIASTVSQLEFIFVPIEFNNTKHGFIRIGPFITSPPNDKMLSNLMVSLGLPLSQRQTLQYFYDSLLLVPNNYGHNLGHIAMNLFGHIYALTNALTYQSVQFNENKKQYLLKTNDEQEIIEKRYKFEKKIRLAFQRGDTALIKEIIHFFKNDGAFKDLFPDNPLRSIKNNAIILNTILRLTVEETGLHPVYVHQISRKFALLIENATTRTGIDKIFIQMYEEYLSTVKQHAYLDVSPFIRKVVDYIQLNLAQPLSVSNLSQLFGIKPSNLANQFKAEMHQTISDFVNKRRIEEASHYLSTTDMQVSDVSTLVGIIDTNYFCRLFKKYKSMTPTQYRSK